MVDSSRYVSYTIFVVSFVPSIVILSQKFVFHRFSIQLAANPCRLDANPQLVPFSQGVNTVWGDHGLFPIGPSFTWETASFSSRFSHDSATRGFSLVSLTRSLAFESYLFLNVMNLKKTALRFGILSDVKSQRSNPFSQLDIKILFM